MHLPISKMAHWRIGFNIIFFTAIFLSPLSVFASATDGTIDVNNKFAWGDQIGWVNFGTAGGNVHVTDPGLTGYAWSSNYGWINLAPAHAGVANTCSGVLSGYGWGENVGYVNFGGVSISASGKFTGTAVAPGGLGSITFDCKNCSVTTDWRYCGSRGGGSTPPGGSGGSSGGGGGGTGYPATGTLPTPILGPPAKSGCEAEYAIGDFNCDGRVDIVDLSIILYYYQRSGASVARYDLNRNGTVDFPDISIMMYHWTG
jgi:hypothetical protein